MKHNHKITMIHSCVYVPYVIYRDIHICAYSYIEYTTYVYSPKCHMYQTPYAYGSYVNLYVLRLQISYCIRTRMCYNACVFIQYSYLNHFTLYLFYGLVDAVHLGDVDFLDSDSHLGVHFHFHSFYLNKLFDICSNKFFKVI